MSLGTGNIALTTELTAMVQMIVCPSHIMWSQQAHILNIRQSQRITPQTRQDQKPRHESQRQREEPRADAENNPIREIGTN